jgi:UDP-N-acetylglucosamine 2-epimerase (non-hydrolysing)
VVGARPNFMKIKPVMDALEEGDAEVVLVHTGQHYDSALSTVFFDELGLRSPDHWLTAGSGSHAAQTGRIMCALETLLDQVRPDVCVVVGDVNSTLAAALVAAKAGSLVAHVEAGLRSRDWSMPEEVNRVVVDRCSDYLLAPSEDAVVNLRAEGYRPDQIHLVGNTMADTLFANLDRARSRPTLSDLGLRAREYGLVTLHRPANVDDAETMAGLMGAMEELAADLPLVFPAHPRTAERLRGSLPLRVKVLPPSGYLDFVALQAGARLVLTDSGGVQEETTMLGVPCLTLRENTERPITVSEGTNKVVGTDPTAILRAARQALMQETPRRRPALWDGRAGLRIAAVLLNGGTAASRLRPTAHPGCPAPSLG